MDENRIILFLLFLICVLITACAESPSATLEISTAVILPPTWTIPPTAIITPTPTPLWSPQPSFSPSVTPEWIGQDNVIQGDVKLAQWLVMVENVRAISLQEMNDGSYLLHGNVQNSPYQEDTLLLRFGPLGEIIWQKTFVGIDPVKVVVLPEDKILILERDAYAVFSDDANLLYSVDILPGDGRYEPLGFDRLQFNISYQSDDIAVMDQSGVVSFFNTSGELIRQEYSDVSGKYQDWMRWFIPGKAFFFRLDDKYNYGFQYREFVYEDGMYGEYDQIWAGSEKLEEGVVPENPVYLITGNGYGNPLVLTAVEGDSPGAYDIWLADLQYSNQERIFPGYATQRDFSYVYLDLYSSVIGSMIRLYNPLEGRFLRLIIPRYSGVEYWDLLFGDSKREAELIGGADNSSGELLLVGNLSKEGQWGSVMFFLKLNPFEMISDCSWIQPSGFGLARSEMGGVGSGRGIRFEKSSFMTLDFLLNEVENPLIQIEDVQLDFQIHCAALEKEPSKTPSPTVTSSPYPGPTWTITQTPSPTSTYTQNP